MARIRTIKPEFWTSSQIAECSPLTRLLFIGMWSFCDDGGVHPDDPIRLKMEVFPNDSFSKDELIGMLDELIRFGLIERFTSDGKSYIVVTGWHHQKIEKKTLRHPQPNKSGVVVDESSSSRRVVVESSPPEGKGMESRVRESKGEEPPQDPPEAAAALPEEIPVPESEGPKYDREAMRQVVNAWNSIPDVKKCQRLTTARERSLNARLGDKFFRENWRRAVELVAASDFCRGKGRTVFFADFEFFLNESSFTKIVEGKYANRDRAGPRLNGVDPVDFSGHEQHFVEMDFDELLPEDATDGCDQGDARQSLFEDVAGCRESGP